MGNVPSAPRDGSGRSEVRIKGHLDTRWAAWFDGFSLTHPGDGTTVIAGFIVDQAALHGVLRKLGDLGLPIVSVTRADSGEPTPYISAPRGNTALLWGSWLEVVTAASCVGTAVALYPVTRRVSRTAAIGFVTSRIVEASLILVGVLGLLTVVTLQHHFAGATGAQAEAVGVTGEALVAMRQWTFLLGPGLMAGVNDLFLGYILYRSRLVPRAISVIGLVGGPIILLSATSTIFGGWSQLSTAGTLCALPVAVFEFSVGLWLTFKGFKPNATLHSA